MDVLAKDSRLRQGRLALLGNRGKRRGPLAEFLDEHSSLKSLHDPVRNRQGGQELLDAGGE